MKDICRDLMVTPLEKRKQNLQNELARIVLVINMERAEYWQAEQNFEPDRGDRRRGAFRRAADDIRLLSRQRKAEARRNKKRKNRLEVQDMRIYIRGRSSAGRFYMSAVQASGKRF